MDPRSRRNTDLGADRSAIGPQRQTQFATKLSSPGLIAAAAEGKYDRKSKDWIAWCARETR